MTTTLHPIRILSIIAEEVGQDFFWVDGVDYDPNEETHWDGFRGAYVVRDGVRVEVAYVN